LKIKINKKLLNFITEKGVEMSEKKSDNLRGKTSKEKKKKRINKKKLLIVILVAAFFVFCIFKASQGVVGLIKSNNKISLKTEQKVKSDEQFDLGDEEENKNKKFTVLIDPGHGGNDKGSQSKTNPKLYEKDLNLEIAKKVANNLSKQKDVQVLVTRTDDKYVSLDERVNLAKKNSVDALISIHLNAQEGVTTATGIETWYRTGATDGSKKLAENVQDTTLSYVKEKDRGILENNFEVLRNTDMPAILVECGFLTNPADEKKLLSSKHQDQLAEGIVQGILTFLDNK
jgi:N-acetylmuramoyl-L-alanine amidase